jgi:hypothetical protein
MPSHVERCCSKCRALPGTCGLQRKCPCHRYKPADDYEPETVFNAAPAPAGPPLFDRPVIKYPPGGYFNPTPGTNPFAPPRQ